MDVTARTWTGYQWRVAIIALMCLGFGGWSLYDGLVGYPAKNVIADAWADLPSERLDQWWHEIARKEGWPLDPREMIKAYRDLDDRGRATQWPDLAAKNGWLADPEPLIAEWKDGEDAFRHEHWREEAMAHDWPEDPADVPHHKSPLDIITQFIMLAITAPIGLVFAFAFVRSSGRWIQCTDSQIITSQGKRVPIDTISRLNKQRWHKGIAVVHYTSGNDERRLVLDDWKFDRDAIDQIVEHLEQQLDPDKIDQPADAEVAAPSDDAPPDEAEAEAEATADKSSAG